MLKLFKHLKPYKWALIFIFCLIFVQTITDLYLPTLMSDIVDTGIVKNDTDYIIRVGIKMLVVSAIGVTASIIVSFLSARTAMGFGRKLREMIFTKVESFSLHEFDIFGTASLITRNTNDVNQVQMVLFMMLRMMIAAPIMCIGGVIMAYTKDKYLTLLLLFVLPVIAAIIAFVVIKGIPLFKLLQVKIDNLNRVVRENLTGVRVIRAFNKVEDESKRFDNANRELTETAIKVNKIIISLMPLMMLLLNLVSVGIVWFGAIRIDKGEMQVGDMMAFIQYAIQILISLIMFSSMFVMVPRASASAERINAVLNTHPEIVDENAPVKINQIKGELEFKNVTFSYPGAEEPAVKNISFKVNPGETLGIIGGTGAGKSTLLNLIMRFYDVSEGSILIDGIDIRKISQEDLRKNIGYVPQKAFLFSGTVADNIRFGKENASDDDIEKACEIAQAKEFIDNFEEKYMHEITQAGTNVSGGQKQRLSIARAIVRKPNIYMFDDSFSALDFRTDARLRLALKNITKDSTVLIVAQRIATIMNADKILVLDDGEIVGFGTHKELLKTCPVYREIASTQLSEEELLA